jgi:hypothetical protein
MQDRRRQFDEIFLQRTAGPYIEVTAPEAFMYRLLCGFGRAKAFGCGLMLLRRAPAQ